jgi:hypothetical protein
MQQVGTCRIHHKLSECGTGQGTQPCAEQQRTALVFT